MDDKGPLVILLHAINYWLKNNKIVPYSIRFLFGTDEETFSSDIKQFKKDFDQPKVVITPDADFPVPYGEKGLMRFSVSQKIKNGNLLNISAGSSTNAVAGKAIAVCKAQKQWIDVGNSRLSHAVKVNAIKDSFEIIAKGRGTHAADPYQGIDSIAILSHFLLEKDICNKQEEEFFKFIIKIAGKPNGECVGLNVGDENFERLTIVPTKLRLKNGSISQTFDVRFPMCTNPELIRKKIEKHMPKGAIFKQIKAYPPFAINPESKLVASLAKSYKDSTGEEPRKFTMGGATYARNFDCGTSFGPIRE